MCRVSIILQRYAFLSILQRLWLHKMYETTKRVALACEMSQSMMLHWRCEPLLCRLCEPALLVCFVAEEALYAYEAQLCGMLFLVARAQLLSFCRCYPDFANGNVAPRRMPQFSAVLQIGIFLPSLCAIGWLPLHQGSNRQKSLHGCEDAERT